MDNKELKKMTGLVSFALISVLMVGIASKQQGTDAKFRAVGQNETRQAVVDTKVIEITKADFGLEDDDLTNFDTTIQGFNYVGTTKQISTKPATTWFLLKSAVESNPDENGFKQTNENGSEINK